MLSAFDQLLENAAHTWLSERDSGQGTCTIWREIVKKDVLAAAREMGVECSAPVPQPAPPPDQWIPSSDWQLRAVNDHSFESHDEA